MPTITHNGGHPVRTDAAQPYQRPRGVTRSEWMLSNAIEDPSTGCLNWTRYINKGGYGTTKYKGRTIPVHRALWIELHGEITRTTVVRHTCHNRRCINPDHLCVGTHAENSADMVKAGRSHRPAGEMNNNAKYTDQDAMAVFGFISGGLSKKAVAKLTGVRLPTVALIANGQRWRHITGLTPKHDNKGENNGQAALTREVVLAIVAKCQAGTPRKLVAKELGVSYPALNAVMNGKNWSWLTGIALVVRSKRGPYNWSKRPGRHPIPSE